MSRHVLIAEDGYGCHLESGLKYTTLCGRVFDAGDVGREQYEPPEDHDHPHATLCFDCCTVANGGSVKPSRRERHFAGGGSA
ncbi:hypothetical protein [Natronorubrum halophilum]|uniref:hypothetical protein n=1 Tax=Natronorubrum halophilum TaxID=1702106 RepID=UPI0010C1D4AC|nr:hypothetical protein [Natronorubrum halophilum]